MEEGEDCPEQDSFTWLDANIYATSVFLTHNNHESAIGALFLKTLSP